MVDMMERMETVEAEVVKTLKVMEAEVRGQS